ncbi:DegT/DnrJ/EryC1/StrS family aminotransferase [Poriferisphaera sp. WC338]|uniref:DegT/DnrJ/EryC1/StrS family aminotransferase n=1 Tax=Poriferisphaera sp. WC338 TaxID=3425129 RepID=UPI003D818B08
MSEIPLSQPDITQADIDAVTEVMRSGRLSIGPRRDLFEELVAERCQRHEAVAVSSGTAGLHLLMIALGIGPGDEVITTPFSFIASANCILMVGATPVFVDIDPQSLNLDPAKLEAAITPKTKAIVAVEVFGNTRHMDQIEKIARNHEIPLIEDACEALGATCRNRPAGSFGRASVFGFYPNKQITTGEGGMIVTDDSYLADACRAMRNQGRPESGPQAASPPATSTVPGDACGSWLAHDRLGYNYRLSEIASALGVSQMRRLDSFLEKRTAVANQYIQRLKDWDDLMLPNVNPGEGDCTSWFVFVVRLSPSYGATERDRIISGLRRHEVGASNYFPCIHLQPFYRQTFGFKRGDFPIAESISDRTIALPFYNNLDDTQIELVCHTLKVMLQREQLLKR